MHRAACADKSVSIGFRCFSFFPRRRPITLHARQTSTKNNDPLIFILLSTASVLSIDKSNSQTMPPFFDRVHLHQAVSNQAVPVLEAIAVNDNLRSLRRFERDDPPPYVSSTESEELDDADLIPQRSRLSLRTVLTSTSLHIMRSSPSPSSRPPALSSRCHPTTTPSPRSTPHD
ncbi:hypothetical protein B0H63DRAFT_217895 [Podospora didyma]|uniref:Uncharacterized protein n=1 Tax=Podospora didyma TaxID=330526 RepID=A0AAE0NI74_9PEZI|nr:hypothetical protein B0H63DRAFT_217895 [Podospora didyma]